MKAIRHASAALAALAICAPLLTARTYIVERGDTWELIARKWGVHTDALKAANPAMPEVFMGLEINLPDNSASTPEPNTTIASYERYDRLIESAEHALARKDYAAAHSNLSLAMNRRGSTTSRLAYLYAQSCEGTDHYVEALENYGQAARLFNNGDRTMTSEQLMAVNDDMERVLPMAQKQAEEEEIRRRQEAVRLENERIRRAAAEAEKKRRRSEFWGNLGMGLLQGLAAGMQAASGNMGYGNTWSAPSMNTGGMTAFAPNATLASAGITIPASLDISQWNPSMFQMQITYDANGNPMYSNPGMAAMMRQMSQDVGNYAAATGASIGGAQGNYLTQLAAANTGWTESQARWAETPHYAPTQEDIDEQLRISAQASKDFRESLTAGKDNLENIKNYNNIKYNTSASTGSTTTTSPSAGSSSSPATSGTSRTTTTKPTEPATYSSARNTGNGSASGNNTKKSEEEFDAHRNDKNGRLNADSDSFTYIKRVNLARRDGDKFRVEHTNIELYKKGAGYFIKMGDIFYRAESTHTSAGYNMRIVKGHTAYFFRK